MKHTLLVGTGKGLVIFSQIGGVWKIGQIFFAGLPVSMIYIDERTNTWWVGISHRHWGEKLHSSRDQGKSWNEVRMPSFKNLELRPGKSATLRRVWTMQHGGLGHPNRLWLGTEPGGLFMSDDGGATFELNMNLWNHPSRIRDNQWFGAGKDDPFIHTITLDPNDSNHLYIAVSCAGIFETTDGGSSWQPRNQGLRATYLPNPSAELGHDPHRILMSNTNTQVMWQQNHCGIYRTVNGGASWMDVSGRNGFPYYGFALAIDPQREDTAWVIPALSDENRIPKDLQLTVCRTTNSGQTWESLRKGLPQENAFDIILRHAFAYSAGILAFGTTNGNVFVSSDMGDSWQSASYHLASVTSVAFAEHP